MARRKKRLSAVWAKYVESADGRKRSFWSQESSKSRAKAKEKQKKRDLKVVSVRKTRPSNVAASPWHEGEFYERAKRPRFKRGYKTTEQRYRKVTGKKPSPQAVLPPEGLSGARYRGPRRPPRKEKQRRWNPVTGQYE